MGNCQAVDAAALVIQHPCGKLERMYWPLTASEVMKTNPGHYVSLIIPLTPPPPAAADDDTRTVRFTRVKLLRPTDTLVLGRAYRLVTTQEVMKVLRAKKHAKMKRNVSEKQMSTSSELEAGFKENNIIDGATRSERYGQRSGSTSSNVGGGRPKSWRPSLRSISEAGS
ncbi:D-ribose-binding periplasmic protein [Perilla frutescens var. hirtella]|uniref:D-ribose-binding periplasmic protein n=1 Tax=Perilla frutescens var. hirtella TaxID=608512 RepID=A0AAD4J552_PERFH|nr:D-ribose-binding periplasmic protein [Perilla frutescens var. hirtella]KAH6815631.1 D-ribose-binding periplasmic protein [Perilla frutescens var. frutescens]KAH6826743.1 D-ribose-binding periplasmic protein [Perilla frutescens var. hirtella]